MPRPPVLPTIDWREVHSEAQDFESWIAAVEIPEHRDRMLAAVPDQHLEVPVIAMLDALPRRVNVLAFAEDWCPDVVRHVPVLEAMARSTPRLQVRYLSREAAPEAFVRYLTCGGEAVPKFVFLSEDWVECGSWGPMPDRDRDTIARGKASGDVAAAREIVAASYAADPARQIVVRELCDRIAIASAERP